MKTIKSDPDAPTAQTEQSDLRTLASNGTSSEISTELEGAVLPSSLNYTNASYQTRGIDNAASATKDAGCEEDVDVLGLSCDTDVDAITATNTAQSCMIEARNCAAEKLNTVPGLESGKTRLIPEGGPNSTNSPTNHRSVDDDDDENAKKEVSKTVSDEKGTSADSEVCNFQLDLEDPTDFEEDKYNRFYFESDHLALKGNKHYQMLLQSLVGLEAQRAQAIKDLDILCDMQKKTLSDPIHFVEKLQNNEAVNLPGRQKVVKVPHIPWEEYTMALGPLERQNLLSHHQTRSAAQQLEKVLSATQSVESEDSGSAGVPELPPSSSNAYSVFGGEFVTSKSGRILDRDSLSSAFLGGQADWKRVSGRPVDEPRPASFNQAWTSEEQAKLERLLQIYPQEDVEAKRWEKIARALGNRTAKQVASRVQKYFIKLAKAGLPVPGRAPTLPKPGTRSKRSSHYQTLGFRNSTFFPSYQPRVYMNDDDDASSITLSDDTNYPSDEESIPSELKETEEYRELMHLKKVKRQKLHHQDQRPSSQIQHHGFMCDGCGMDPITGLRFHCLDCPQDASVDFCADCIDRGVVTVGAHQSTHRVEPINAGPSFFVDGDYIDYNYLDTNFLPAAS